MTTPEPNQQEEKARLWAEMDAAESGNAPAAERQPEPTNDQPHESTAQERAPAPQADAQPGEQTPEADDPYAGLPQSVRDELTGLKTLLSKTTDRLRNTEGHIGGLKTQLQQLAAAQAVKPADGPSASELRAAQKDSGAMAKLLEDYPELGETFKTVLEESVRPLQEQLKSLSSREQPAGITPQDLARMKSELTVEAVHPGWQEKVRTAQFVGWLQGQPPEVQMLAASESPRDAIRLLDLNSKASNEAVTTRNQRLNSAAAMPSGRASAQRAKPVESMSKEEYWAYLDSIEQKA